MTGEFLAQRASNAENISIWWRRHVDYNGLASFLYDPSGLNLLQYLETLLP